VPFTPADDGEALAARFAELHRARYGFTLERPVEVIAARHAATRAPLSPRLARQGMPGDWDGARVDSGAPLAASVRGRATIVLPDATLLVAAGWTARALPIGGWMLERDA